MNVAVIIPAYNESKIISTVISSIKSVCPQYAIIVVDDGSNDDTYQIAKDENVIVLRHVICCGKGAAIKTGVEYTKAMDVDVIITMDGDGQHDALDIPKIVSKIEEGYEVVLGSRMMNANSEMPIFKIFSNKIANLAIKWLYGIKVTDSQSGFRAYSKETFDILLAAGEEYVYDSEVLREIINKKHNYVEIPINVIYSKYSQSKNKKQDFKTGLQTLITLILNS